MILKICGDLLLFIDWFGVFVSFIVVRVFFVVCYGKIGRAHV